MKPALVAALALVTLLAAPVRAEDRAFDGLRAGVLLGGDNTDAAPGTGARGGFLYGWQIGYDRDFGGFVLGAEADLAGSTASSRVGAVRSDADRYITLAARAGLKVGDRVLAFARGGYANARVSLAPGGTLDRSGFTVGGGLEAAVWSRFYVRGEYRYSDYGDRLRGQQYVASVGVRF